jgi:hypothetical protein
MSDTPRTDAEVGYFDNSGCWRFRIDGQTVGSDFARTLERELAAAKAWKDALLDEACIVFVEADDPRDCIKQVIQANVTIALDPLVSAEAERLVESGRQEMKAENERLRVALQEMIDVDDEPCSFDRNGYCQSHYFDHDADGCRVAAARAALAKEKS